MANKEKTQFIKAWRDSADDDLETAKELFKLERYNGCLFFCHLSVEKILKAVFVKIKDTYPPFTHKLAKLAKEAKVSIDKNQEEELNEISTFNVEARYDVFKQKLYKKATKEYTNNYLKITGELLDYFRSLL